MRGKRVGEGGTKVDGVRAAAILFTDGQSLLLLKRAGDGDHIGKWALPGGKAKKGETDIGAAVREAQEETGLTSVPGYRFGVMATPNGKQKFTCYLYKVAEPFDVRISREHSDWKWFDFDDLKDADLHPKFKLALPEYLRLIRRKVYTFKEWASLTAASALLESTRVQ